jgi:hypothetical protein
LLTFMKEESVNFKGVRTISVIALFLSATGFLVIPPPTVQAVPPGPSPILPAALPPGVSPHSGSTCPKGYICLFTDSNFSGTAYKVQAGTSVPWFGDFNFNDAMSSWANDSGRTFCWYTDANYVGLRRDMKPGYRVNLPANENDTASSLRPC